MLETELEGHRDSVRDVAWSPVQAHGYYTIASCVSDSSVVIWKTEDLESKQWSSNVINQRDGTVHSVSWQNGVVLAVKLDGGKLVNSLNG